jgi:hypothetical protein
MAASAPYRGYQIVKEYGKDIAEEIISLWKEGYSVPRILEFFQKENINLGKGTVDSFIKSAQDRASGSPFKITKADINNRPDVVGANQFMSESYINNNQIVDRIEKAAKAGKQSVTEFLETNPDLNRSSLYKYLKNTGTSFKKIDQGGPQFQQYVTDRVKVLQKLIKKDPNASSAELLQQSGLPTETYNSTVQALKKSYETPRPKFKPDPKLKTKVLSLSDKIPTSFETKIFDDMKKLGINPDLLDTERLKKVTRSRRALTEFFDETNFEHKLPKQLLKYIDDPNKKLDLLLTGTRTSPELNQFKKRYDNLMGGLVNQLKNNEISLKEYNQKRDQIVNEVKRITGGYEMGYLKFNKAGPDAKATAVVKQKPFYEGTKLAGPEKSQIMSAFENVKFHNNLIKKYKADPNRPAFSGLRENKPPEATKLELDAERAFNKFKNIVGEQNKQKFLQKAAANINSPFIQAIFKSPYGKGAAVTGAMITPTALSAQEAPTQFEALETGDIDYGDPETWTMKVGEFIEEAPVLSGTIAAATPLLTKPGQAAYKKIGAQALKILPTPLSTVGLIGAFGVDPESSLDRATLGAELAFAPELVKQSAKFGPTAQRILNLGLSPTMALRAARFASPVGIATLGAEGAYQFYQALEDEKARIAAMSPEERQMFEEEQTAAAYMGEAEGFAYGGRVGLEEGGPPDPSKRKFIKRGTGILGALTAIGTGAIKLAPEISKVKEIIGSLNVLPKNAPEWLLPLYKKIKSLGKESKVEPTKEGGTGYKVTDLKTEDGSYKIVENEKTGEVVISADTSAGVNEGPLDFIVRPRKITGVNSDGTPIVDPGEFKMVENRAVGRMTSPEDYELDIDEYVTNNLDDLGSDWHAVEEFATGKTDKTLQAKKLEGKKFIEENPGEDVVNRQGEYDYMGDDSMMEDY